MAVATAVGFNIGFARFFFASGSDALMELISSNMLVRISLLLTFIALVVFAKKFTNKSFYYTALIVVFSFWLLSGRMIGIFPDGRIKTGWFYFTTNEIHVCQDDKTDCEIVMNYQSSVEKTFLWQVRIKNNQFNDAIFTGPIIWHKTVKVFESKLVVVNTQNKTRLKKN